MNFLKFGIFLAIIAFPISLAKFLAELIYILLDFNLGFRFISLLEMVQSVFTPKTILSKTLSTIDFFIL
jgi:hypothetical protein